MKISIRGLALISLAVAALLATPAFAQDGIDNECVASCRDEHRDCRFDAREAASQCLEEAGCTALREDYRAACFSDDRDEDVCAAARGAYRECKEPCRDEQRDAAGECRDEITSCLADECGIDEPLRRPGRRGGRRGFGGRR